MIRAQVRFTEKQWQALKRIAASRHVSVAELVRQSVDQLLNAPENRRFDEFRRLSIEIIGKYQSGSINISTDHDKYLAEDYRS